ncbi:MAG TPA: YbaB/EbfC family nucleoid-associated protein [Baekduia sp.]|uniref:YbaB/EbfC family nucleoid-associated protein n=1 Tax=Baekduia sp. TaxID=2600305 RepID=UPI002C173889|nr:YbaB/EbfC family nucleoid-associated protein [Baekduia sp.]HMJ34351.1 YbaB/EbfC family nucleoid-associated protein [Baekduia sp.]
MPQPNIQNMLKQAQEVMAAQQEAQDALKEQRVEASAGGGMVKVTVTGDLKIEALTIDPDAVDPEDVEMLQDLVLAATNEALRQAVDLQEKAMQGASGAGGFDPMQALEGLGLGDALGGLGGGGAGGVGGPGSPPQLNRAARRAAQKKNR